MTPRLATFGLIVLAVIIRTERKRADRTVARGHRPCRSVLTIWAVRGRLLATDRLWQIVPVAATPGGLCEHAGPSPTSGPFGAGRGPGQGPALTQRTNLTARGAQGRAAGEEAGTRGVPALAGLSGQLQGDTSGVKLEDARVARLPDGKDPDEVVRESPAAWEAAIAKAKPLEPPSWNADGAPVDCAVKAGCPMVRRAACPVAKSAPNATTADKSRKTKDFIDWTLTPSIPR